MAPLFAVLGGVACVVTSAASGDLPPLVAALLLAMAARLIQKVLHEW